MNTQKPEKESKEKIVVFKLWTHSSVKSFRIKLSNQLQAIVYLLGEILCLEGVKKQTVVSRCSVELEYRSVTYLTCKLIFGSRNCRSLVTL